MLNTTSIPKKKIGRPRKQTNDGGDAAVQAPKQPKRSVGRPRKQQQPPAPPDTSSGAVVTSMPLKVSASASALAAKKKSKLQKLTGKAAGSGNKKQPQDSDLNAPSSKRRKSKIGSVDDVDDDDDNDDGVGVDEEQQQQQEQEQDQREQQQREGVEDEEDGDDDADADDDVDVDDEEESEQEDENGDVEDDADDGDVVGAEDNETTGDSAAAERNDDSDDDTLLAATAAAAAAAAESNRMKPKTTPKRYAGKMSTKISAADSTNCNLSSTTTTAAATSTTTNSNSNSPINGNGGGIETQSQTTPVRKLRTRNSIGSNASGEQQLASLTVTPNGNQHNQYTPDNKIGNGGGGGSNNVSSATATPVPMNLSYSCVTASKKYHNSCPHPTPPSQKSSYNTPHSSTRYDSAKNAEFEFKSPPECPVYRPTEEQFRDPISYINSIRSEAEKYGIVKLIPPSGWSPPFAVDTNALRFVPRVQKLNELDAKTRTKLNFLDKIAKFWELQGQTLRIPTVERKALDLYSLHRIVQEEGGMERISKERKWTRVATTMGYPVTKGVGATLKSHYERILLPYEAYTTSKTTTTTGTTDDSSGVATTTPTTTVVETTPIKLEEGTDYKVHGIENRQQITPPNGNNTRRSKRFANSSVKCGLTPESDNCVNIKSECKRDLLASFNDVNNVSSSSGSSGGGGGKSATAAVNVSKKSASDAMAMHATSCIKCEKSDSEELMLICYTCGQTYHTYCLVPALPSTPKGVWNCPACVVEEVSKPFAFGFEQANTDYTLKRFGAMADKFKENYFRADKVACNVVEREFWRIVSSIDEDVTVEYGADLHTMDHGSGFPTRNTVNMPVNGEQYVESPWNLNNLPLLPDSILGHINLDISGMNAPWMYVGMCFAAFCWHIEDHWSYSINYMHWGEPKTWYGVPGSEAVKFEDTMKRQAPELFRSQPDLLHQLVTIMNPNTLQKEGVPVYRTDQCVGEFVVTFPRAYHAGFNQGFNFAEAVNFAPADWLKLGRECIEHYSTLRRFCVFSHDELVCKMALDPDKLTVSISTACYLDMVVMVDSEKKLRKSLLEWGVTTAERRSFETNPDDDRHCQECNTTCFMSAVSCKCTKDIVCLRHYTSLCKCPPSSHTLLYRYTLDEIPLMISKLRTRFVDFDRWMNRCHKILTTSKEKTATISDLHEICEEARAKKFPITSASLSLYANLQEAQKCVQVIHQLGINKIRTRSEQQQDAAQYKLSMNELDLFVEEINNLCCVIDEGNSVSELLKMGKAFLKGASEHLSLSLEQINENELQKLVNEGAALRIFLPELEQLSNRLEMCRWYRRSVCLRESNSLLTYRDIKDLLIAVSTFTPMDPLVAKERDSLTAIGAKIEEWEVKASHYVRKRPVAAAELSEIENLLKEALEIKAQLPSYASLKDGLRKAKEWLKAYTELMPNTQPTFFYKMEALLERARNVPFPLVEILSLQKAMTKAGKWKTDCTKIFLKPTSHYSLLELLMPRPEPVLIDADIRSPYNYDAMKDMNAREVVRAFKLAESKELSDMRELRKHNAHKRIERGDLFCHCKQLFEGRMYNCQLCLDWFHEQCVTQEALEELRNPAAASSKIHWLCASCKRSKRPQLQAILPLLVTLQELPIRLPEDETLRCLAERAMAWQDVVNKELAGRDYVELKALIKEAKVNQQIDELTNSCTPAICPTFRMPRANLNESNDDDDAIGLRIDEDVGRDNNGEQRTLEDLKADWERLIGRLNVDAIYDLMMQGDLIEVSADEQHLLWSIVEYLPREALYRDGVCAIGEYNRGQECLNSSDLTPSTLASQQQANDSANQTSGDDTNDSLLAQSSPNNSNISGRTSTPLRRKRQAPATDENGSAIGGQRKKRKADNAGKKLPTSALSRSKATEAAGNSGEATLAVTSKAAATIKKQRKRGTGNNAQAGSSANAQKKRLRGAGTASSTRQQQQQQQSNDSPNDDDEDDDDVCAAENCAQPSGDIDWVQCDGGCNSWFHMQCVGLVASEVKPEDEYHCVRCRPPVATGSPNVTAVTEPRTTSSPTRPTTPEAASPTSSSKSTTRRQSTSTSR